MADPERETAIARFGENSGGRRRGRVVQGVLSLQWYRRRHRDMTDIADQR